MKFSYLVVRSIFIFFFIIVARFSVGRDINISLLNLSELDLNTVL